MSPNPERLKELREKIEARRTVLEAEIREDLRRVRHDSVEALNGAPTDAADVSLADLIADLDSAETTRDIAEFRELQAALDRMRDGDYGTCAECGRDIGWARLEAQPAARRCVECQRLHERTHASPGTPTL